jgi:MFS family permease
MALTQHSGGFGTLLKKKDFLYLWLAQLISMTILNASSYALLILIQRTTGSITLVGLAIISFSLPAVLFGAPAGVFVDRMNKRRVMWASNCLRAAATFLFVIILLMDRGALFPLYFLTFVIASIGQFFAPAEGSTIPLLVGERELMPALSLFNITFMLAQALGMVIFAPILISVLPTFTLFAVSIDAITQLYLLIAVLYLLCALLVIAIPRDRFKVPAAAPTTTSHLTTQETLGTFGNVWNEMTQGWRFIRRKKPLFQAVIQISFAGVLILVVGQLATAIVTNLLQQDLNNLPFVFAPAGVGLVAGSVIMPRIVRRFGNRRTMYAGIGTLLLATALIPTTVMLAQSIWPSGWNNSPFLTIIVGLLMFVAGVGLDLINIPAGTAMQELSPNWIKGRVLALQLVFYNACSIPIILFLGALTDILGIGLVLYLMAGCELAFVFWNVYYERKHPRKPQLEIGDDEASQENEATPDKVEVGSPGPIDG